VFALILVIIYVGAIIIFIGYICAISPNLLFSSAFNVYLFFLPLAGWAVCCNLVPIFRAGSPFSDFLYSSYGFYLFFIVALVLFLILLAVSSQFFRPKGPFRSVS